MTLVNFTKYSLLLLLSLVVFGSNDKQDVQDQMSAERWKDGKMILKVFLIL